MTYVLAGVLALLVGVVLGMLGGGGAILTLPMLVYVAGVDPKAAIATSLLVVGTTSLVGSTVHARARRVQWRLGVVFGSAAMAGAFVGGRLARFLPATGLLVAFAVIMLATAAAMLKGRSKNVPAKRSLARVQVVALGASVGLVSGLVGAGGGFLVVPALTLFGGLAMREAVGTSLFVIALQSFAGFAGHIGHVSLDWRLAGVVTGAAVIGTIAGGFLGSKTSPDVLRRAFAWLVLGMGLFILGKQLSTVAAVVSAAIALATVFLVTRKKPRPTSWESCTTSSHSRL